MQLRRAKGNEKRLSMIPPRVGCAAAGNLVEISWPAGYIGWRLESRTNSLAGEQGTNWQTEASSALTNRVYFPINAANASCFFRLVYP